MLLGEGVQLGSGTGCLQDVCVWWEAGMAVEYFLSVLIFLNAGGRGGSSKEKKTEQSPKSVAGQEALLEAPDIRAVPGEKSGPVL